MYSIWANLSLWLGFLLMGVILWFILTILGKAIFEDFLGAVYHKLRSKASTRYSKDDDDPYVY